MHRNWLPRLLWICLEPLIWVRIEMIMRIIITDKLIKGLIISFMRLSSAP